MPAATFRFARDQAVAKGIVVNGLVILTERQSRANPQHTNPPGGIEKYYRENVIGGPGSFVIAAEDYNSFGRAMVQKLIAEIAARPLRAALGIGRWRVAPTMKFCDFFKKPPDARLTNRRLSTSFSPCCRRDGEWRPWAERRSQVSLGRALAFDRARSMFGLTIAQ